MNNKLNCLFIVALSAFCGLCYLFVILAVALYYPAPYTADLGLEFEATYNATIIRDGGNIYAGYNDIGVSSSNVVSATVTVTVLPTSSCSVSVMGPNGFAYGPVAFTVANGTTGSVTTSAPSVSALVDNFLTYRYGLQNNLTITTTAGCENILAVRLYQLYTQRPVAYSVEQTIMNSWGTNNVTVIGHGFGNSAAAASMLIMYRDMNVVMNRTCESTVLASNTIMYCVFNGSYHSVGFVPVVGGVASFNMVARWSNGEVLCVAMGALLMLIHIALVVLCIIRDRRQNSIFVKSDSKVTDKDWDGMREGTDTYEPPSHTAV